MDINMLQVNNKEIEALRNNVQSYGIMTRAERRRRR